MFEQLAGGFAERLHDVTAPAEVLAGAASPLDPAVGEELARRLPNARLTVIAQAGHLPWHEQPGCVRDALARIGERVS